MKIESIEATAIEISLPRQFAGSVYAMTTRCAIVTRMRTSDGWRPRSTTVTTASTARSS
jgi:hypothetical protein